MEIHINFEILNEVRDLCHKTYCYIYVLYVLNKEALIEIFFRI